LSKDDPKAGGRQHLISIDWVDYVSARSTRSKRESREEDENSAVRERVGGAHASMSPSA
jgi:hypothetical protein